MHKLPLAHHIPEHALGRPNVQFGAIGQDLDGRAEGGALAVARLGGLQLLFPAVDVVDDGDVLGAVLLEGGEGGELGGCEAEAHGEAHEGGEEAGRTIGSEIFFFLFCEKVASSG